MTNKAVTSSAGESETSSAPPVQLQARKLWKHFGDFAALRDVSLTLRAGSVHALVGSNGSGKSTLVKILSGVYQADPGTVLEINGVAVRSGFDSRQARRLGVQTLHQDAPLVDAMTIDEITGLFYGYPTLSAFVRWKALRRTTQELLDRVHAGIDATKRAGELTPAERAIVGLALALGASEQEHVAPVIILDEPTSPLSESEAKRFLTRVRDTAAAGAAVLLVTHRLSEVEEFCDEVTVLRGGQVAYSGRAAGLSEEELVAHMVGPGHSAHLVVSAANVPLRFRPPRTAGNGQLPIVQLDHVEGKRIKDVSLHLALGEVLGLTGPVEGEASEVGRLIAAVDERLGGAITINGQPLPRKPRPRLAQVLGVAYLPADRLRESGIAALSVRDNIELPNFWQYWWHRGEEDADLEVVMQTLDVRPPDPSKVLISLSGGNQQKVLLGKWLLKRPKVLVLDSPTNGIDPTARELIFRLLRGLAGAGTSLVLISNEAEHLARVCDRVVVLDEGLVRHELTGDEVTEEEIRLACIR